MMNVEDDGLFEIFPAIKTISEVFEYQNAMLNKIVLTGKINALDIAENLFNFTEQTAQTFTELQGQIVLNLLRENKNELFLKTRTKSQIAIDTLMKNISSRKSDIDILSKDRKIKQFLNGDISKKEVKERLNEFVAQYSVYNEIIIFDSRGYVKANINEENKIRISKDSIINKTFINKKDDVLVEFKTTDMFLKQRNSLFFSKKIEGTNAIIVVFFNFLEETNTIFNELVNENETIVFADKHHNIISSNEKGIDKSFLKGVKKVDDFVVSNNMFYVKTKSNFESDLEWYAIVAYKRRPDINVMAEFNEDNMNNKRLAQINLNNKELQKLADDGYAILEDLSDVIINGELIAAKSKQYILIPILDNLREVSFKIVKLIELSISNLQKIINDSITSDVLILSKLVTDSIMRSFYEKCSDVKWWGNFLGDIENNSDLSKNIKYLNNLYQNYTDIFVYDEKGSIVATSNSSELNGEKISHNATISNKDKNRCFISKFEKTKFYNFPTYTYFATLFKDNKSIGGIGAVLDIKKEFDEIMERVFCYKQGIVVVVDSHKNIIYSNDNEINGEFDLLDSLEDEFVDDIEFNNKNYKIAVSKATEYRGYENNDLYSIILMEK